MAELAHLYRSALDCDCFEVTSAILGFYDDWETVLFELIGESSDSIVQSAAVIGLKQCFLRTWSISFVHTARALCAREAVLRLAFALPLHLAKILVDSARPVFVSEGENWPELLALLFDRDVTQDNIILASHLLGALMEAVTPEFAAQHLNLLVELGNAAMGFGGDEGWTSACYLFSPGSLLTTGACHACDAFLKTLFDLFPMTLASVNSNAMYYITRRLGDCFSGAELAIPPAEILGVLLDFQNTILNERARDRDRILCLFILIQDLLVCQVRHYVLSPPHSWTLSSGVPNPYSPQGDMTRTITPVLLPQQRIS